MASVRLSAGPKVPQLMTAVKQLDSNELLEFQCRLAEWRQQNGMETQQETELIQACKIRLSVADEKRIKKLIAKSERGDLSAKELEEYRSLAKRAESLAVTKLAALTQLARLWCQTVPVVMETIGWEDRGC
jgi:hypothetical protein